MSATPAIPPVSVLNGTLGSIEIGGIVGTFLFGIVTLQVYNYYRQYPGDSGPLKLLVAVIWFLELGHAISTWHAIFTLSVTFYGQPAHLSDPPDSIQTTLLFSAPIYALVQLFFANRVRVLSGRMLLMVVCGILTFLRFMCSVAMLVITYIDGLAIVQKQYRWLMATGLSLGATVDIFTALSMCVCLWQLRRSMFHRTKRMADIIIAWSIETGMATSGASFIQLFLFLTRDDLIWFPFFLITARLFSNSLMVSLNSRQLLRSMNQHDLYMDPGIFETSGTGLVNERMIMRALEIEMSVEIEKTRDDACNALP
ncbi:hypothetical protein C8R44DRAFT_795847 [Mycena epipterygia]|nr:hypothetical protein C8R44DRAFT_795847 [Mycena epipterygia]